MEQKHAIARLKKFNILPQTIESVLDKKQKQFILKTLTREQLLFFIEAILNLQNKNFTLPDNSLNKIKKYHKVIKFISDEKNSLKRKRDKLQKGKFLNVLLPILSNILPMVLDKILKKE